MAAPKDAVEFRAAAFSSLADEIAEMAEDLRLSTSRAAAVARDLRLTAAEVAGAAKAAAAISEMVRRRGKEPLP
jgi:hypothetical protein